MRGVPAGAAAVGFEALAALIVGVRPVLWPLAALAHVVAAVLAARGEPRERPDRRVYTFAVALALPGLGLAVLAAIAGARRVLPKTPDPAPGPRLLPEPDVPVTTDEPIVEWVYRRAGVRPLADVVRRGTPAAQAWAVRVLGQRDDAAAVELLRDALQSSSRDVQIAAAAALRRIDDRLSGRVIAARRASARVPEDAGAWGALGDAWRAHAASGLLPRALNRRAFEDAAAAYERALALDAADVGAMDGMARTLVALERPGEAEVLLRARLAAAPTPDAELALAGVLFEQRRWGELRDLARGAVAAGRLDEPLASWAAT